VGRVGALRMADTPPACPTRWLHCRNSWAWVAALSHRAGDRMSRYHTEWQARHVHCAVASTVLLEQLRGWAYATPMALCTAWAWRPILAAGMSSLSRVACSATDWPR
jgi:hypothetical protein